MAFVDIAGVRNALPQGLHALLVPRGSRADVVVVAEAHAVPEAAKLGRDFIGELLRRLARGLGGALDFLAVLVGARKEPGVVAEHTMAAGDGVTGNGSVGVANVRARVDVIDWSRDVELLGHDVVGKALLRAGIELLAIVAPPSRRLSGVRYSPPLRGRDALGTAGRMPALQLIHQAGRAILP